MNEEKFELKLSDKELLEHLNNCVRCQNLMLTIMMCAKTKRIR